MLVELDELLSKDNNRIEIQEEWRIEKFSAAFGDYSVCKITPVDLILTHTGKKQIQVDGSVTVTLEVPCDRCLEPVLLEFTITFHEEVDCGSGESTIDSEDAQYVVDDSLDVGRIIQDELLVQWPAKILCKEDCKGICKVCGHNLNVSDCGCDRVVKDPRMAAIQDIFNQANQ